MNGVIRSTNCSRRPAVLHAPFGRLSLRRWRRRESNPCACTFRHAALRASRSVHVPLVQLPLYSGDAQRVRCRGWVSIPSAGSSALPAGFASSRVGTSGIEPLASPVSGECSSAELSARVRVDGEQDQCRDDRRHYHHDTSSDGIPSPLRQARWMLPSAFDVLDNPVRKVPALPSHLSIPSPAARECSCKPTVPRP